MGFLNNTILEYFSGNKFKEILCNEEKLKHENTVCQNEADKNGGRCNRTNGFKWL